MFNRRMHNAQAEVWHNWLGKVQRKFIAKAASNAMQVVIMEALCAWGIRFADSQRAAKVITRMTYSGQQADIIRRFVRWHKYAQLVRGQRHIAIKSSFFWLRMLVVQTWGIWARYVSLRQQTYFFQRQLCAIFARIERSRRHSGLVDLLLEWWEVARTKSESTAMHKASTLRRAYTLLFREAVSFKGLLRQRIRGSLQRLHSSRLKRSCLSMWLMSVDSSCQLKGNPSKDLHSPCVGA